MLRASKVPSIISAVVTTQAACLAAVIGAIVVPEARAAYLRYLAAILPHPHRQAEAVAVLPAAVAAVADSEVAATVAAEALAVTVAKAPEGQPATVSVTGVEAAAAVCVARFT
jgi:hypothetical protein